MNESGLKQEHTINLMFHVKRSKTQAMTDKPLSERERDIVDAYLHLANWRKVAEKIGLTYDHVRRVAGKSHVKRALIVAMTERAERTNIDADWVLLQLKETFEADPADILTDEWTLRPLSEWPDIWRKILSGFDVKELFAVSDGEKTLDGFLKKIKWPDKLKTLELMGKHVNVGAFADKHVHEFNNDLSDNDLAHQFAAIINSASEETKH